MEFLELQEGDLRCWRGGQLFLGLLGGSQGRFGECGGRDGRVAGRWIS